MWGRIRGRGRLRWGLVMGELGLLGVICEVLGMGFGVFVKVVETRLCLSFRLLFLNMGCHYWS